MTADLLPLRISRIFSAPRAALFKAWSSAEHVKNWFSPETYSVAEAIVDMRVGGAFDVCMRSPAGTEHWTRGVFIEVQPHDRLVIDMRAVDANGAALFQAYTEVSFADDVAGTRMDVVQTYRFANKLMAAPMVAGAAEGWRTTLDKLQQEVARIRHGAMPGAATHGSFTLQRSYDAPVARVWAALTDPLAKAKWFVGPWELLERTMDVSIGGRERLRGRWKSGLVTTFDATYFDIVPNRRPVYTYEMHLDDVKISVSLATMQLDPEGSKTTLTVTEQGAFLDGYDDAGSRERGSQAIMDKLGAALANG